MERGRARERESVQAGSRRFSEGGQIEKTTKKKRTGKLAPFPPEYAHLSHLARTHAIFAHFESIGETLPPSVVSTPQHAGTTSRMALRERKMKVEEYMSITPPPTAARRGRGRGAASAAPSASNTPRGKTAAQKQAPPLPPLPVGLGAEFHQSLTLPASSSMPAFSAAAADSPQSKPTAQDTSADDLLARALAGVDLDQSPSKPTAKPAAPAQADFRPLFTPSKLKDEPRQTTAHPRPAEPRPWNTAPIPFASSAAPAQPSEQSSSQDPPPRIILRFPKLPRSEPENVGSHAGPARDTPSSGSGIHGAPFPGAGFGSQ